MVPNQLRLVVYPCLSHYVPTGFIDPRWWTPDFWNINSFFVYNYKHMESLKTYMESLKKNMETPEDGKWNHHFRWWKKRGVPPGTWRWFTASKTGISGLTPDGNRPYERSDLSTWRIIPTSKWLVTPIYKPFRPFGRGTTLLRGLTITMVINHLQVMGWSSKQEPLACPCHRWTLQRALAWFCVIVGGERISP